ARRLRPRQGCLRDRLRGRPPARAGGRPARRGGAHRGERVTTVPAPELAALRRLAAGGHTDPHQVLGRHGDTVTGWRPDVEGADVVLDGGFLLPRSAVAEVRGAVRGRLAPDRAAAGYRLRVRFAGGGSVETDDPYRFLPTVGQLDLHLFGEGRHRR